jgi:hypothetical protein
MLDGWTEQELSLARVAIAIDFGGCVSYTYRILFISDNKICAEDIPPQPSIDVVGPRRVHKSYRLNKYFQR